MGAISSVALECKPCLWNAHDERSQARSLTFGKGKRSFDERATPRIVEKEKMVDALGLEPRTR